MFRKFKVGPIVGQRTWGGLVGILGFPVLMDGGDDHRAEPGDLGRRRRAGSSRTKGVPPDIEVEQTPADVIAGRDPQLERAIADRDGRAEEEPAGASEAPGASRSRRA